MKETTVFICGNVEAPLFEKKSKFYEAQHLVYEMFMGEMIGILNPVEFLNPPKMLWGDIILRDLFYLSKCDMVYMLKGWEESQGAKIEHEYAKGLGIEIRYQK